MARGPLTFRQRDVEAAVKALANVGKNVASIEIKKDGTIRLDVGEPNIGGSKKLPVKRNSVLDALK